MNKLSAGAVLIVLLSVPFPVAAHTTQSVADVPVLTAGLSLNGRSAAAGEQGVWRIPGALMGGHALPGERGLSLDDAFLSVFYPIDPAVYVAAKVATHDTADSSLALEEAMLGWQGRIGQQNTNRWRAEAGRMMPRFLPALAEHASERRYSDTALPVDVFFGRQIHDEGVRLWWEHDAGWSAGAEWWHGSAFPSTSGRDGGAADAFVQWAQSHGAWAWQLGGWYFGSDASQRSDERYVDGGHSHAASSVSAEIPDTRFTGRTRLAGVYGEVDWRLNDEQQLSFSVNWLRQRAEGELTDATRLARLDTNAQGGWMSASWRSGRHEVGVRWEQLVLDNTVTGVAATVLAEAANLINQGHEPARLTLQWRYRVRDDVQWRVAWVADDGLPERREHLLVGLVWQWQKQLGHPHTRHAAL